MSHVNCLLSGHKQTLSKFNPEALDDDINVASFRGLGRGRGFEKTGETSTVAPRDPITNQMKDRYLAIINFLLESGYANLKEVYETLNIQNPQALRENLNKYEAVVEDLLEFLRTCIQALIDEYKTTSAEDDEEDEE
jgi:hypothetical protein